MLLAAKLCIFTALARETSHLFSHDVPGLFAQLRRHVCSKGYYGGRRKPKVHYHLA